MQERSVEEEMEHARVCLAAARSNLSTGFVDVVYNRCYYAVFHAARSIVLARGITSRSHKGLFNSFSAEFVKTGTMPRAAGTLYKELIDLRATADYGYFTDLNAEDAAAYLPQVADFLARAEAYLAERPSDTRDATGSAPGSPR